MTEPDEALICARRWRSDNLQALGLPSLAQRVADGETDETLKDFALGYRAGQAASAERIKALEEAIREAMRWLNEYADMTLEEWDATIADNGAACWMLIRAQLKTVVVGDLNRALLPEADQ